MRPSILLFITLTATTRLALASDQPLVIERGTDVISKWSPDQHLYVKGNVGVTPQRLAELESWLDQNASNWTIVLLANARGESYQDTDGHSYSGMDAVEFTCGKGLINKTGFGDLKDPRTGQSNGASFVLFLAERKFSYIGSDIHNQRDLGADAWIGKLDQPAYRAMTNGGRVIDAVKETVKEVDARLTRQLALEQQRRQRAIIDAQKQKENAGRDLALARELLTKAGQQSFALATANPNATGDLAKPDIASMQTELDSGDALLTAGQALPASRIASAVKDWAQSQLQLLDAHSKAAESFQELHIKIAELNPTGDGWRAQQFDAARTELVKAQNAHTNADSIFISHLENARGAVDSTIQAIERSKVEAARALAQQQEMERHAEITAKRYRDGAVAGGTGLLACLAGGGIYLSRRRKPIKVEAEELLASWDRGFDSKTQSLFKLLDRTAVIIGSEADLPKRGYTGETLTLSKQTIEDVDELFIMSSAVDRVLREARKLVHPSYSTFQVINKLSTNRYLKAMKLLRDQPITFSPEDGIEPILRVDGEKEKSELLGKIEAYKPFALSFTQLVDAFNERETRARKNLNLIEESWAKITASLDETQQKITAALKQTRALRNSADDQLFTVPAMDAQLIGSAQSNLDAAIQMSTGDPVQALATPIPTAKRQASEAKQLAQVILSARNDRFPSMREDAQALDTVEHLTSWIDEALAKLSTDANDTCINGIDDSIAQEIALIQEEIAALDQRIEAARELSSRLRQTADKQLESVEDAIRAARVDIGMQLSIDASRTLIEIGLNPDARLKEARSQHQAAFAAINRGSVDEANAALNAVQQLTDDAFGVIAASRHSLEEFSAVSSARLARRENLQTRVTDHATILRDLESRYSAATLCRDTSETAEGTPEQSIAENIDHAENALTEAQRSIEESKRAHDDARLIESANLLAKANEQLDLCDRLFDEVRDQKKRIEEAESKNNVRVSQLRRERETVETIRRDPAVMQATLDQLQAIDQDFESAVDEISAASSNPFAIARDLNTVDLALDSTRSHADSDRKLFSEAQRSIQDVEAHLAIAEKLAHSSQTDNIPDSRTLIELQEFVGALKLKVAQMERTIRVSHSDWLVLDQDADRAAGQASRAVAEMRGELQRAQAAVAELSAARSAVRSASGWSGGYGVRINGTPGGDLLEQARQMLISGLYLETQRLAQDSNRSASHALTEAKRQVARHREAELRAAEEARQAEERRRRSRQASSFGSRSSTSGTRSSGMGRSSFSSRGGSSGSGMSRSGW
jgi:hypothetical protein